MCGLTGYISHPSILLQVGYKSDIFPPGGVQGKIIYFGSCFPPSGNHFTNQSYCFTHCTDMEISSSQSESLFDLIETTMIFPCMGILLCTRYLSFPALYIISVVVLSNSAALAHKQHEPYHNPCCTTTHRHRKWGGGGGSSGGTCPHKAFFCGAIAPTNLHQ